MRQAEFAIFMTFLWQTHSNCSIDQHSKTIAQKSTGKTGAFGEAVSAGRSTFDVEAFYSFGDTCNGILQYLF